MKRKTIRNHKDFSTHKDTGAICPVCIIKIRPAKSDDARYGVIAPKRIFRTAVERNRAKRLLRDWIAFNEEAMSPDTDYIFIARDEIFETNREDGRKKILHALKRISK